MINEKIGSRVYTILGIIFALLSLVIVPYLCGLLAIIFGIISIVKGYLKLGILVIILGIIIPTFGNSAVQYIMDLRFYNTYCSAANPCTLPKYNWPF